MADMPLSILRECDLPEPSLPTVALRVPHRLVLSSVTVRGWTYHIAPALDLPIRCVGDRLRVEHELLGIRATASDRADLCAAVGEQLHAHWQRLMLEPGARLKRLSDLSIWFALGLRVQATPPPVRRDTHGPCPPGCLGGNGCNHSRR